MILKVVFPKSPVGIFDYQHPPGCAIQKGVRVLVPFGSSKRIGYVLDVSDAAEKLSYDVKEIIAVLDDHPTVDENAFKFARSISEYYFISIGEALEHIYPTELKYQREKAEEKAQSPDHKELLAVSLPFYQRFKYYKKKIKKILLSGRSVSLILPTLSEVDWAMEYLKTFRPVGWDSSASAKRQSELFSKLLNSNTNLVVGTRRATFLPVRNLDTIIVDREYDYGHRDGRKPYYNARTMAFKKAEAYSVNILFGGMVFSTEIYNLITLGKIKLENELCEKKYFRQFTKLTKNKTFSFAPLKEIADSCYSRNLTMIIHNPRRGFASGYYCYDCKTLLKCPNCDVPLTYHKAGGDGMQLCNYCGYSRPGELICGGCGGLLKSLQFGTQQIEVELKKNYPAAEIFRYDIDTKTRRTKPVKAEFVVSSHPPPAHLFSGKIGAIILLNADLDFIFPEFYSNEKIFLRAADYVELAITTDSKFECFVQTNFPEYHIFGDTFSDFYKNELELRKRHGYPPFCRFMTVIFKGSDDSKTKAEVDKTAKNLEKVISEKKLDIELIGPSRGVHEKIKGNYFWKLIMKGSGDLAELVKEVESIKNKDVKKVIEPEPL